MTKEFLYDDDIYEDVVPAWFTPTGVLREWHDDAIKYPVFFFYLFGARALSLLIDAP
jgi:hypothetical protein